MLDISDFPWAECTVTENRTIYQDDSLSLKRSRRNTGNHRWEFELVSIDIPMKEGRRLKAQLSAAVDDTIIFTHPRLSFTEGREPNGGLKSIQYAAKGTKTVKLVNKVAGNLWYLYAGDLIQFARDTKVYEVAKDANTLGTLGGTQYVELTSPLRNDVLAEDNVTVNGIQFYLLSNGSIEVSMEANENQDMELTLVAVEKL